MMLKLGGDIVQSLQLSGPGGGTARTGSLQTSAMLERKPRVESVPRHAGRADLRAPVSRTSGNLSCAWALHQSGDGRDRLPERRDRGLYDVPAANRYLPLPDILVCSLLDQGQLAIRATERPHTPRAGRGRAAPRALAGCRTAADSPHGPLRSRPPAADRSASSCVATTSRSSASSARSARSNAASGSARLTARL